MPRTPHSCIRRRDHFPLTTSAAPLQRTLCGNNEWIEHDIGRRNIRDWRTWTLNMTKFEDTSFRNYPNNQQFFVAALKQRGERNGAYSARTVVTWQSSRLNESLCWIPWAWLTQRVTIWPLYIPILSRYLTLKQQWSCCGLLKRCDYRSQGSLARNRWCHESEIIGKYA